MFKFHMSMCLILLYLHTILLDTITCRDNIYAVISFVCISVHSKNFLEIWYNFWNNFFRISSLVHEWRYMYRRVGKGEGLPASLEKLLKNYWNFEKVLRQPLYYYKTIISPSTLINIRWSATLLLYVFVDQPPHYYKYIRRSAPLLL